MPIDFLFVVNSLLIGVGLAMDAFSVSVANGLNEPRMSKLKASGISAVFGIFQAVMPFIGWVCVSTIADKFNAFNYAIPWIALVLLGFIGGKMVYESLKGGNEEESVKTGFLAIIVQGVATSIDALSVGFTISDYDIYAVLVCVSLITIVTFTLSFAGVYIGKKFGNKFSGKAELIGGLILIAIGIEIFIKGMITLYA